MLLQPTILPTFNILLVPMHFPNWCWMICMHRLWIQLVDLLIHALTAKIYYHALLGILLRLVKLMTMILSVMEAISVVHGIVKEILLMVTLISLQVQHLLHLITLEVSIHTINILFHVHSHLLMKQSICSKDG